MLRKLSVWASGAALIAISRAQSPPDPMSLWQVTPEMDVTDHLYAGWSQIPVVKEIEIYNGVSHNRTYAHHPELFAVGNTIHLSFSSAVIDEDSMGQDVRISTSTDGGMTWNQSYSLIPPALLPNQTEVGNYTYWCTLGIAQRAWQALAFVQLPGSGYGEDEVFAIGQSGSRWCPASFRTAGRVARRIGLHDGQPISDPCWIEKNELTDLQLYNQTVWGTKYGMKYCDRAEEISAALREPDVAPAWSSWLYNNELFAADDIHSMQEQTHSVWFPTSNHSSYRGEKGYWQRFWRDISGADTITHNVWVEYNQNKTGEGWYPKVLSQHDNKIYQTNIPDANTKSWYGQLSDNDRYFINNPKYNFTIRERQPLTLAMSRGSNLAFKSVGVLRTKARDDIAPDTRSGLKSRAKGFSYPSAVQVGDRLLVAYSENKENIWVSVVDIADLPK